MKIENPHAKSSEAAAAAAGGAAEDGPRALPATTHGPAAELLYEGEECDVDMGAALAATAAAAAGVPPRPSNWGTMTRAQRKYRKQH